MDQAKILRDKFQNKNSNEERSLKTKSISVTSGKGGVGKTSFSINLACALAKNNKRVLLTDCDFGLANVDVILNLTTAKTLENLIAGNATIEEVVLKTAYGFDVLPASSGIPEIADMEGDSQKFLIKELARIQDNYDYLLFDTGSGIHKATLRIVAASDQVIVVTNPEPTSITDAYSIIKTLRNIYKVQSFSLIVMKANHGRALQITKLLEQVANDNGVIVELKLLGAIDQDVVVEQSIYRRKPWFVVNDKALAVDQIKRIAIKIIGNLSEDKAPEAKQSFWKKWWQFSAEIKK